MHKLTIILSLSLIAGLAVAAPHLSPQSDAPAKAKADREAKIKEYDAEVTRKAALTNALAAVKGADAKLAAVIEAIATDAKADIEKAKKAKAKEEEEKAKAVSVEAAEAKPK